MFRVPFEVRNIDDNLLKSLRGYRHARNQGNDIKDIEYIPYRNLINLMVLTPEDMYNDQLPFMESSPYFTRIRLGTLWSYKLPRANSSGPDDTVFGIMVEIIPEKHNPCGKKRFIMRRWVRDWANNGDNGGKWSHMYNSIDSKDLRKYYGDTYRHLRLDNLPNYQRYEYHYIKETTGSITGRNGIEGVISDSLPGDGRFSISQIIKIVIRRNIPNARRQITFRGSERRRRAGDTGRSSMMMMPMPGASETNNAGASETNNESHGEKNINNKRRARFQSPIPEDEGEEEKKKREKEESEEEKKRREWREEHTKEAPFICGYCYGPLDIENIETKLCTILKHGMK